MRPNQFIGKKVVDSEAKILGEICDFNFNVSDWTITHISVELTDDSITSLEYKKPFMGKIRVELPVNIIHKVSDLITLNQSISEVKNIVERTQ
jgi:sporulation protein YlmC with PRC-barrel domain